MSRSQRNYQSGNIKQLNQITHRLVQATERDGEDLIIYVPLKSVHI